jgi:hypothetical protein
MPARAVGIAKANDSCQVTVNMGLRNPPTPSSPSTPPVGPAPTQRLVNV